MRLMMALVGTVVLLLLAGACGNDSDTFTSADSTDGGGLLEDAGSLSGLEVINPLCGAGDGGEVDGCDECVATSCATEFAACFGSSWETDLAGICSDFGDCVTQCDCGDPDCFGACSAVLEAQSADPCLDCVRSLLECELGQCATECQEDTADAGAPDSGDEHDGGGTRDGG